MMFRERVVLAYGVTLSFHEIDKEFGIALAGASLPRRRGQRTFIAIRVQASDDACFVATMVPRDLMSLRSNLDAGLRPD